MSVFKNVVPQRLIWVFCEYCSKVAVVQLHCFVLALSVYWAHVDLPQLWIISFTSGDVYFAFIIPSGFLLSFGLFFFFFR